MKNRVIAETDRKPFFARFTEEHEGALVTVRINAHEEVVDRPLRRLQSEGPDVVVEAGEAHRGRRISKVAGVQLQQTDAGADAVITMISDDGTQAEIRLRSPLVPDLFDPGVE